jgi:hypothetical protein
LDLVSRGRHDRAGRAPGRPGPDDPRLLPCVRAHRRRTAGLENLSVRDRWTHHRAHGRLLLQPGGPQQVIDPPSELARGRRGKKVNRQIRYLRNYLYHMRYAGWRAARTPIGSGVVERAIRRVINLRFEAASMYW